jgi:hypothetical protein
MLIFMTAVCLVIAAAMFFLLPGQYGYLGGFVIGAAAQLIKFGFIDIGTIKRLAAQPDKAGKLQLRSTFLSLVLFGAAIALAFKLGMNIWAWAGGIFLPRLILLADAFVRPDPFNAAGKAGGAGSDEK